jgi:hypothetical protein
MLVLAHHWQSLTPLCAAAIPMHSNTMLQCLSQAEYLALDMPTALREAGFDLLEIRSSSPSHIALIARKPE